MAAAALGNDTEHILVSGAIAIGKSAAAASFADEETESAARTLFSCVMQHKLSEHLTREVVRRSMFPVSVFPLTTLFCEAMAQYKLK